MGRRVTNTKIGHLVRLGETTYIVTAVYPFYVEARGPEGEFICINLGELVQAGNEPKYQGGGL